MQYKLVAYMEDGERSWPVTVGRHYETAQEAEKDGYDFVHRYDGGLPRCMCFQVLKNTHEIEVANAEQEEIDA